MFDVYFRRSNGEDEFLANCADFHTVNEVIKYFLDKHNYKYYYSRMWKSAPGVMKIDVGSHTEFFYCVSEPNNIDKVLKSIIVGEE